MVKIIIGAKGLTWPDRITYPGDWFDAEYEQSWFQSDLAKTIVKEVDLTTYVDGEYFQSPILGGIPPYMLSTGCKSLLVLLNLDNPVASGERFGDNCAKWILEIGKIKDLTITIHHVLKFPEPFEIQSLNSGKILRTYKDYINEIARVIVEENEEYENNNNKV